jgi:hypothetical protein
VQQAGFPFKSYEFTEGKLDFLDSPHRGFRLERVSPKQYMKLYANEYDTGMTGSREEWIGWGLCGNTAMALVMSALVGVSIMLIGERLRAAPPPTGG